ncbi:TPA: MurR/RpiR family transcriptional regulator, partial [Staphylococcus aureus]|nr:MurR/RpiR family transcriptional regulator [Staphylococcus aureus]
MTNILYRIDKQLSDFTKTEKIIADYILKNPHKIIDMTVNDLADVTNVST